MSINRINQRISNSKKASSDYYIPNMEYWIATATANNDKAQVLDNINASNGIVSDDVYEYVLNPLQSSGDKTQNLPGVIRNIDFITPIREKNIGEYLQLPNNYTVKVDDPDISIVKDSAIADKIRPIIEQKIVNLINEQRDTGVPTKAVPDIQKEIKEATDNWFDERAENAHELIKRVNDDNDYENKRLTLFNYWWATEHVYIYLYNINGVTKYDVISPLEGYPVNNDLEFVEDGEAFLIIRDISIDRIQEYYDSQLTVEDRKYIDEILDRVSLDGSVKFPVKLYQDLYGRKVFRDGVELYGNSDFTISNGRVMKEQILFYKTEVKKRVLKAYNRLGRITEEVVDADFILDETLGHIEIKDKWITECWKQVLLGEEQTGIYLKPEPIDVQIYNESGNCKLPVYGKKGLLNGIYINPIPKRIIGNLALYNIITLQVEREMAMFKGTIEIIPQSMLRGADNDAKGVMFYRKLDRSIIYDDTQIDFNTVAQGYRLIGNDTSSNYIKTLLELRNAVKAEAWDMSNMNDSRYGNAAPSSTVTNNNQNIYIAKLGSMLMVTIFNNVLCKVYNAILDYAKVAYIDGITGSNFNKDGTISYFNIKPGELTANRYGIFATNSIIDFNKLKEYKELAFNMSQNGDQELAAEAIDNDNVSGIRKYVKAYVKTKSEYEQSVKQQELAQAKQIHDEIMQSEKDNRQNELDKIEKKEQMITDREIELANINARNNNDSK